MAHFVDMNEAEEVFRLPYVDELQRCESTERKVQFIIKECQKLNIPLKQANSVQHVVELCDSMARNRRVVSK